eukprot:5562885-Karenia_brevis.AAC.1
MGLPKIKKSIGKTRARLDVFSRGVVWGMHLAGAARAVIQKTVTKKDNTPPTLKSIDQIISHMKENPDWKGTDSSAGGRPKILTPEQQDELEKLVFAERGKAVVTASYCRKRLRFLRTVSRQTVVRSLHDAGLAWMTRRTKTKVYPCYKPARLAYADWILA